jgi:glutathione S-transferase
MKTEILLQMASLPYRTDNSGFLTAPKGKLLYIDDDGEVVADSTFIRWHLEKKYGIDFDAGLTPEQRAIAWAFKKMAEDQRGGWTTPRGQRRSSFEARRCRCVRSSADWSDESCEGPCAVMAWAAIPKRTL